MNIFNTKNIKKKIDKLTLPSQNLFYKDDFEVYITKCDKYYIKEYETKLDLSDITKILKRLTRVIIDHTSYSKGYSYRDLVSIDLVFIFLEIVKYTKNEPIILEHYDKKNFVKIPIEIGPDTYKYYKLSKKIMKKYDKDNRCFDLHGYMVSLPNVGVEEDLTDFLTTIAPIPGSDKFNDYEYNFLYVLGNERELSVKKILDIINIFNHDITQVEKDNLSKAVDVIRGIQKYQINYNGVDIPLTSKLDLVNIFKK